MDIGKKINVRHKLLNDIAIELSNATGDKYVRQKLTVAKILENGGTEKTMTLTEARELLKSFCW